MGLRMVPRASWLYIEYELKNDEAKRRGETLRLSLLKISYLE